MMMTIDFESCDSIIHLDGILLLCQMQYTTFVILIVTVIVIVSVIVVVTDLMCLLVDDEPSWRSEYTSLSTC